MKYIKFYWYHLIVNEYFFLFYISKVYQNDLYLHYLWHAFKYILILASDSHMSVEPLVILLENYSILSYTMDRVDRSFFLFE